MISYQVDVYSQTMIRIRLSDFKHQEAGFREAWSDLKAGDKFYKEGPGSYHDAIRHYKKVIDYHPYHPGLNYKLGVVLLKSDRKEEALTHFKRTKEFLTKEIPDIDLMIARSHHFRMEFEDAIRHYKDYVNSLKPKEAARIKSQIDKFIYECNSGIELLISPVKVNIVNLGREINSEYDEYYPVLSYSGQRMFFTSRRPSTTGGKRAPFDNKYYEDIYFSFYENGWGAVQNIGAPLNTTRNDVALAVAKNDSGLYINSSEKKGNILFSEIRKNRWGMPKPMVKPINSRQKETSFSITADEETVYFVSERPQGSQGGRDIYFMEKDSRGRWGKAQNLGPEINTEYDEEAVFIHPEGHILYFSSQGHNSMGGYDVFYSEKRTGGTWSKPVNMGHPINTPDDELFFSTHDQETGYFSAIRPEGFGGFDLYKVVFEQEEEIIEEPEEIEEEVVEEPEIAEIVVEEIPYIMFEGKLKNKKTNEPVFGKLEVLDLQEGRVVATTFSDQLTGNFIMRLPEWKDYGVEVSARDYLFFIDLIKMSEKTESEVYSRDLLLDKIEVGVKVVMNNIFFDLGKSSLKPESYKELDNVVKMMNESPDVRIEISGHTDNTGSLNTNVRLSQERAKSVVDYLVARGIDLSRLEYRGYGPSQPVAPNETEDGRSRNRRVEFKILGN